MQAFVFVTVIDALAMAQPADFIGRAGIPAHSAVLLVDFRVHAPPVTASGERIVRSATRSVAARVARATALIPVAAGMILGAAVAIAAGRALVATDGDFHNGVVRDRMERLQTMQKSRGSLPSHWRQYELAPLSVVWHTTCDCRLLRCIVAAGGWRFGLLGLLALLLAVAIALVVLSIVFPPLPPFLASTPVATRRCPKVSARAPNNAPARRVVGQKFVQRSNQCSSAMAVPFVNVIWACG